MIVSKIYFLQLILALILNAPMAFGVEFLSQRVKHTVTHHVILTMEGAQSMRSVHCNLYSALELLAYR